MAAINVVLSFHPLSDELMIAIWKWNQQGTEKVGKIFRNQMKIVYLIMFQEGVNFRSRRIFQKVITKLHSWNIVGSINFIKKHLLKSKLDYSLLSFDFRKEFKIRSCKMKTNWKIKWQAVETMSWKLSKMSLPVARILELWWLW